MPAPAVVPVLFDEAVIAYDLERLPQGASIALQTLRSEIRRDGGLPTARLKRCAAEARDGTRLPNCLKTYVPWGEDKWGLVLLAVVHPERPFALRAFAYGSRHPTGLTASVYRIAHQRLNDET